MEIFVYSRNAVEAVKPHDVPHVIISITSRLDDVARLRVNETCRGVLRLTFPDADAESPRHGEAALFSPEQATRVWEFVLEHHPRVERLLVHCDAGLSRSPAMAAAISKVLNGDDSEYFGGRYVPNMLVYRTLLEVHEESFRPKA